MFNISIVFNFASEGYRITDATRPRVGALAQQLEPSCRVDLLRGGSRRDDGVRPGIRGKFFISRTLHQRLIVLNKSDEIDRSIPLDYVFWRLGTGPRH